jgi:hypothetical protein
MKPEEIDKILAESAESGPAPGSVLTEIERKILRDLRPVQPLGPAWMYTAAFASVFAALAIASATVLGFHGFRVLSAAQRSLIFPAVFAAAWFASAACNREMRPGSGRHLGAWALIFSVAAVPAVFVSLWSGYDLRNFVREGVPCLEAGLSVAFPTSIVVVLVLRKGFVLNWITCGIAAGTLSGLAGLGMLELHCPNLKAIHVIVWHVAVVVVSAFIGLALGGSAKFFRARPA